MKKKLILSLLSLLTIGTITACAPKPSGGGFKSLCSGKVVEAATPYDRMVTGQFGTAYVMNTT